MPSAVAERALLDFMGDEADQRVRAKRAIVPRTGSAGRQIRCDEIGPETPIRFPTEHGTDHGVRPQVGQHDKPHFRIRREVSRMALDAAGTGAKASHADDWATTG